VGVAIDKPGHDYSPGRVDLDCITCSRNVFQAAGWTNFGNNSFTDQDRPIRDNINFVEGTAATRPSGPTQGKQLAGTAY
jgi:hypothetical protein